MKIIVSLKYAQKAAEAISDHRYIDHLFERTSTNVWELIDEEDLHDHLEDEVVCLLEGEAEIPTDEYEIEF